MRRLILPLLLSLWAVPSEAQRPAVHTTIQTTSTAASSLLVGCAFGATTGCTGGINSGPIVVNTGGINIVTGIPGDTTMKLYNNAGTLTWNGAPLAAGSSVSGTTQYIPFFTASNAIGDSIMSQDVGATTIDIDGDLTADAGTFSTTLDVTGVATFTAAPVFSSATANLPLFANGSKALTSNAITGTGSVVMSNSPTLVTPALGTPSAIVLTNATGFPANVALLDTAQTFTATKKVDTAAMTNAIVIGQHGSASTYGILSFNDTTTWAGMLGLVGKGSGDNALYAYVPTGGSFNVGVNDTQVWKVNATGVYYNGNLTDSYGTPSCTTNCTTVVGRDYAFRVTGITAASIPIVVTFGNTWTNAPICTTTQYETGLNSSNDWSIEATTTTLSMWPMDNNPTGVYVICRGY